MFHCSESAIGLAAATLLLLPEEQQLLTAATRKLLAHDSQNAAKSVAAVEG